MRLTTTERGILELLLQGASDSEMAQSRKCTVNAVKMQMKMLCAKFGVEDGVRRVKLAMAVHARRHQIGVRCTCDAP